MVGGNMDKRRGLFIWIFLIGVLFSTNAHAILEVRGSAGFIINDPHEMNQYLGSKTSKEVYLLGAVGGDAFLTIPLDPRFSLGLGARFEYNSIKVDSANGQSLAGTELQTSRTAALLVLRGNVKDIFYYGLVGTIGLAHTLKLNIKDSSQQQFNFDQAKGASFSVGPELGFYIKFVHLGLEMGYQYLYFQDITGPAGTATFKANLSGYYTMAHLGFGF